MSKFKEMGRASDRFVRGLAKLMLGLVILTLVSNLKFGTPWREIGFAIGALIAIVGALQITGFRFRNPR